MNRLYGAKPVVREHLTWVDHNVGGEHLRLGLDDTGLAEQVNRPFVLFQGWSSGSYENSIRSALPGHGDGAALARRMRPAGEPAPVRSLVGTR